MTDKPRVIAFFLDEEISGDDPYRAVKLKARQLADPHYQAGQSAAPLQDPAACFADPVLDPESVWDAGLAAGLTDAQLDSAAHVAVVLAEVEHGRHALPWWRTGPLQQLLAARLDSRRQAPVSDYRRGPGGGNCPP